MANEANKDIVIECSPYGDTETEIVNLKTPSYEIISMPDLFEYEKSLSIFIYVVSALGLLGFFYLMTKTDLSKFKEVKLSSRGLKDTKLPSMTNMFSSISSNDFSSYIYYFLLFLLFFIGIFVSVPQEEDSNLIPVYILFVIVVLILTYKQYSSQDFVWKTDYYVLMMLRSLFPSPMPETEVSSLKTTGVFFILWILLYVLISLFRMADNIEDAFSPIGLLSSYCFLKILEYMITFYNYRPRSIENENEIGNLNRNGTRNAFNENENINRNGTRNAFNENENEIGN